MARAPLATLSATLPSASAQALVGAGTQVDALLAGERQRLRANPPAIQTPTGLPASAAARPTPESVEEEVAASGPATVIAEASTIPQDVVETSVSEIAATRDLIEASAQAISAASASEEQGALSMIAAPIDVRRLLRQSPSIDSIDTGAGERPGIALTGELDPTAAARTAAPRDAATVEAEAQARSEQQVDPGFDAIGPRPTSEIAVGSTGRLAELAPVDPLVPETFSGEVTQGFDQAAATRWSEATAQASLEHDVELGKRTVSEERAWTATEGQIAAAEGQASTDQRAALEAARGEAQVANASWVAEIGAARATYQGSRSTELQNLERDVEQRRIQGEGDAARELTEGERRANAEKARRQREIDDERARVERESEESDGFLGWLASKVEAVFDALADFVNGIFNALRRVVSGIIAGAKWLARQAINIARRAINGIIRLAAGALERAANFFLAAFPRARARVQRWIRDARDTAIAGVDRAADWLAAQVDRLLDALGTALDAVLSLYQRAYLAILNGIRSLVLGFLAVLRGIARLVDAARAMPDYFEGEVETELIGQDLTQPLFFERTATQGAPALPALGDAPAAPAGPLTDADLSLLGQDRLRDDQAAVDTVADFDPEPALLDSLALPDGGEVEFPGVEGPDTSGAAHLDAAVGAAAETGAAAEGGSLAGRPDVASPVGDDTESRLQQLMAAEPDGACEAQAAPTGAQAFPENQKFGPLTRGQRARYLLSQMGKGIRQWFACNWPWLLAATLAALVGIIVLEIVTGGAITAALPILLQILAAVMIGAAVIKAGGHVLDYLTKAWSGDIQGGGRSLAKGLAVGAVELIFAVLTYITAGAFRVLAAGARAAGRAVRAVASGAARLGRAGASAVRTGVRRAGQFGRATLRSSRVGRAVLVRGRLVFRGLRRGFARGARTLNELGERLGRHFRFRRFRIRRRGRWFQLFGYFNPWVLLANGRLVEREIGGRPQLGDVVNVGGRRGIVVGVRNAESQGVDALRQMSRRARQTWYRRARRGGRPWVLDELAGVSLTGQHARELREAMVAAGRRLRRGQHAHHIGASTHPRAAPARQILEDVGIHFNDQINGVAVSARRHARLHTHDVIASVNRRLDATAQLTRGAPRHIRRAAIEQTLDDIARIISSGRLP